MVFSLLFSLLLSLGLGVALARVLRVCAQERYRLGLVLGLVRLALLGLASFFSPAAALFFRTPTPPNNAQLGAIFGFVGPFVSPIALFVAYRRFRDVPAAEEEKAQRPFRVWLVPATIDLLVIVIAVGGVFITSGM